MTTRLVLTFIWKIGSWWRSPVSECGSQALRVQVWMSGWAWVAESPKDFYHAFFLSQVTHSKLELTGVMDWEPSRTANAKNLCLLLLNRIGPVCPLRNPLPRGRENLTRLRRFWSCFPKGGKTPMTIYRGTHHVLLYIFGSNRDLSRDKSQLFSIFKVNYLLKLLSKSEMSLSIRKDSLTLNPKHRR